MTPLDIRFQPPPYFSALVPQNTQRYTDLKSQFNLQGSPAIYYADTFAKAQSDWTLAVDNLASNPSFFSIAPHGKKKVNLSSEELKMSVIPDDATNPHAKAQREKLYAEIVDGHIVLGWNV
jgi:hypothetical protein